MTTTEERQSPTAGQRAAKAGAKHLGRKIGWILGAKIGFWVAVVLVLLLLVMAAGAQVANQQQQTSTAGGAGTGPGGMEWDPGNIISDAVFYNSQALPDEAAVQAALDEVGGSCYRTDVPPAGHLPDVPRDVEVVHPLPGADQRQPRAVRGHPAETGPGVRGEPAGRDRHDPEGIPGSHPAQPTGRAHRFRVPRHRARRIRELRRRELGGVGADPRDVHQLRETPPGRVVRELPGRQDQQHSLERRRDGLRQRTGDGREPSHRDALHVHPVPAERRRARRLPGHRRRLLRVRQPQLLPDVPGMVRTHRRRETRGRGRRGAGS